MEPTKKQMMSTSDLLKALFTLLNKEVEYAVLRNYEGLPQYNNSRDIDIIIERQAYKKIRGALLSLIEYADWRVLTYLNSDRLITWVCTYINNEGAVELIQLDFFFNTSVFGLRLLSAKDILAHRQFNGSLYHVDKHYEFLDKYLYNRAVGAGYPEKYKTIKEAVGHSDEVRTILRHIFGANNIDSCDKMSKARLLSHAFMANPLVSLEGFAKFTFYRVRNYVYSNAGFSVGFTGPDGSGKTTIINLFIDNLGDIFRKAYTYYHFRPTLFGNLGDVAQATGLKKDVDRNYNIPHRGERTGKLNSVFRLFYYSVDYILGYWLKVKAVTRITRLVIFDRYFTDIICDSRRSRIYLNPKLLYCFGKVFIPALDYNILLTAKADTILKRKQELDKEGIKAINDKIDYLANKKGYYKILNESTPQAAVSEILRIIFEEQHKKNLKRLK